MKSTVNQTNENLNMCKNFLFEFVIYKETK